MSTFTITTVERLKLNNLRSTLLTAQAGEQKLSYQELKDKIKFFCKEEKISTVKRDYAVKSSLFFGQIVEEALLVETLKKPVRQRVPAPVPVQQPVHQPQQRNPGAGGGGQQPQPQRLMNNVAALNLPCSSCGHQVLQLPFVPQPLPGGGYRPVRCTTCQGNHGGGGGRNRHRRNP